MEHTDPKLNGISIEPTKTQRELLTCSATELLFDGPPASGKLTGLLAHFGRHQHLNGHRARGLLTVHHPLLVDRVMSASEPVFADATLHGGMKEWRFPNGASLTLRVIPPNRDMNFLMGNEYSWIGHHRLDANPTPREYLWLFSCLRSPYREVRCRVVSTSDLDDQHTHPMNAGLRWVEERFVSSRAAIETITDPDTGLTRRLIQSAPRT